jgi:hydroxymethylpyrimidine pyrophosphatase-like HAD family hydrolase
MRYHALACDYDGTVATHGSLTEDTREAVEKLRSTGRKVILVTGRRIDDLQSVCPDLSPFDIVVGENGGVLYWPATRELRPLVEPPPPIFAEQLRARGVTDVAEGQVIVATWQPHEATVLAVIQELGLELQVIFNKGAVMVLPSGVNKATGLRAALEHLKLSEHNVVGVGDAENDHALLAACECGVAVANAVPMLREKADLVTGRDHGAGVIELIDRLINNDLAELAPRLSRHDLAVGTDDSGETVTLPAYGVNVLLAGTSGAGKSTFATAFIERLDEHGDQYCVLDPEGDYGELPGAVTVGTQKVAPSIDEVCKLLEKPVQNAVVNLLAVGLGDRPAFLEALLPRLQAARNVTGRPHFVILDEVHHLVPAHEVGGRPPPPREKANSLFMITVHPLHVARELLATVDVMVVVGASPRQMLGELAAAMGVAAPDITAAMTPGPLRAGEALVWWPRRGDGPRRLKTIPSTIERRRHIRKYADGEIQPERSFYFRGPTGSLNLRAHNLMSFLQIGDGVDEDTWRFHLRAGDYSRWLEHVIKDRPLAEEVAEVERADVDAPAAKSRRAVREAIEKRYTAPS